MSRKAPSSRREQLPLVPFAWWLRIPGRPTPGTTTATLADWTGLAAADRKPHDNLSRVPPCGTRLSPYSRRCARVGLKNELAVAEENLSTAFSREDSIRGSSRSSPEGRSPTLG